MFNLNELFTPLEGLQNISVPFSKEEIDKVIQKIPIDKAPGPEVLMVALSNLVGILLPLIFIIYARNLLK
jgi:hypothetical protein